MADYRIYSALDESGNVHYVGCTRYSIAQRATQHFSEKRRSKRPFIQWLSSYGGAVTFRLEEIVRDQSSPPFGREKFWIEKFKAEGHPIKNAHNCVKILPSKIVIQDPTAQKIADGLAEIEELKGRAA